MTDDIYVSENGDRVAILPWDAAIEALLIISALTDKKVKITRHNGTTVTEIDSGVLRKTIFEELKKQNKAYENSEAAVARLIHAIFAEED